jgi:glycolate oxidase
MSDGAAAVLATLASSLRPDQLLVDPADLDTYDRDGLAFHRYRPRLVVVCASADEVAEAVRACIDAREPFVARGAGTGLSGGATPFEHGVVISLAGLTEIDEVAIDDRIVVVGPGVTNLGVTRAVEQAGCYYAPDPSSQIVCTIGGNVAENSGGAHCAKYGFTTNHLLGMDVVTAAGEQLRLGSDVLDPPGYDLRGVFIGSEGTFGVATRVIARVLQSPEAIATALAGFASVTEAAAAVAQIVAAGIVPACLEMLDHLAMTACEQATGAGLPLDAAAALLIECDGPTEAVDDDLEEIRTICSGHGATSFHLASDDAERALLWRARKAAFASMGRLAPDYIVQDGVIPRTELAGVLAAIAELAAAAGLEVANVFHAGDGNLHPLVLYDGALNGATEAATELGGAIVECCIAHGGSITGEHGVGLDKACHMPSMFTADDLAVMQRVRHAFDPFGICNPGKIFPTPRLCGEVPGHYAPHPIEQAGLASRW